MRKIIQIQTDINSIYDVVALCDDGTVWKIYTHDLSKENWQRFPDIPQDDIHD